MKVYVIHVKGDEERRKHISNELKKFDIDFEFILDGNKQDITPKILDKYFRGEMYNVSPRTSCALKHIYAYERIVEKGHKLALIFEDDIILKKNYNDVMSNVLKEIEFKELSNFIISLENSGHNYIKRKEVVENQFLYKKDTGRCAGAYIVDYESACSLLQMLKQEKCGLAIDWFHTKAIGESKLQSFWVHPYVAEQGSHNGKIKSLLDDKKYGWFRHFVYSCQRFFRNV